MEDLITSIDGLGLPKGIEQGRVAMLNTAEKKITQQQYTPARNTLIAFINQVNARWKKTFPKLKDSRELISIAQPIINAIPGNK